MATRAPAARGFTVAEKRSILFERIALYAVFLVALIAAVISFQALRWVGTEMGLGWAAPLVPLAIDGFAVACSVGIVRSQASGEHLRERFSEWIGLFLALALSITGNILHAMHTGSGIIPAQVTIAFAASVPVVLAYGIHVYGRAMVRGISAHVLADDPDRIHFDVVHLGDDPAQPAHKAPRIAARPAQSAPAQDRAPAPRITAQPAAQPVRAIKDPFKVAAREMFDADILANPTVKPDAARIHREIGTTKDIATTRRWVQKWWEDHEAELGMGRPDQILEQVSEAAPARDGARTA